MRKKNILLFILLIAGILMLPACTNDTITQVSEDERIEVMVSIVPQLDFVERIGGDKVDVNVMIPPGFSPATYDPSPEQLKKLQDAELYFRIGHIPFEKAQMDKLTNINRDMKVVDTSENISLLKLADHSHEDEDEEGDDPHIWLSPKLVKIQAGHIYNALVDFQPENEEYFTTNYNKFIADLDELDNKLKDSFAPIKGKTIFVFHPAFGYLADAYGFEQEAIEIEGKEPSPEHLKNIIDEAKKDDVHVIFVQKQFSTKSAEALAEEIDGVVIQIDPLAENYFDNLEEMADTIVNKMTQ